MVRRQSSTQVLMRSGFTDSARAGALLQEPFIQRVLERAGGEERGGVADLLRALAEVPDPDLALLSLTRVGDSLVDAEPLLAMLAEPGPPRDRLLAVLGGSAALADWLVAHPVAVEMLADSQPRVGMPFAQVRRRMLVATGADPEAAVPVAAGRPAAGHLDSWRRAYRRELLLIAADDLTAREPHALQPQVAAALADLAAAALEGALALARAELGDQSSTVRLAVLGMGKLGGRELNYISDVDVIYVVEPAQGASEDQAVAEGAKLAAMTARMCSTPSAEPALWEVDAALRPEGKNGPLVRTLDSHLTYYRRWAKTWEFQALLKARHAAGDADLSQAYLQSIGPMVWEAVNRENFVQDAQAMRRRVEENVPVAEADRQIKLGRGGLRDVEFTVQLLQLVHGRVDADIRSPNTLDALAALSEAGYVGRDHAAELAECYQFLRLLEHRIQLFRMRRTHLFPTAEEDVRRLSRSVGLGAAGAEGLRERWRSTRRKVRHLHEELFYRPLLPATARLSADDAALSPETAAARLSAIGYRDPKGAVRHIAALSEGISRRAAIQRQLLPVLLGWFAEGADPDGGLLSFRKLSEELGTTYWYLKLLRDSGAAAERLAHLLSSSKYVAAGLIRSPESVAWLGQDKHLRPRPADSLWTNLDAMLSRRDEAGKAANTVRYIRRRELTRGAIGDVLGRVRIETMSEVITPAADLALKGVLRIARDAVTAEQGLEQEPATFAVVAMGRLGGVEMGYASDADVLFVYEPAPGDLDQAKGWAMAVASQLRSLLGATGAEPALPVDADLRPEGRQGPMVRTLSAYAEYYARWAQGWERQALLRARPVAGDEGLGDRFVELIDPLRYPAGGLAEPEVRELRRIKARVEKERMPRGVPASHHLKLGRGGLTDVEWTVQLLQLQYAATVPELRTTATLAALQAAQHAELLSPADTVRLRHAWELASRLRNGIVLATGRASVQKADVLPGGQELAAVARLLGYAPGHAVDLDQHWLRASRRARAVMERVFFG